MDEEQAAASGTTVVELAQTLHEFARELVPDAETHAAVALSSEHEEARRLRAVRSVLSDPETGAVEVGLDLNLESRRLTVDGRDVPLTRREFDLLAYLRRHPGRAVTRRELMVQVWETSFLAGDRTVDVHVRRLRHKLGVYGSRIATVRGFGYRYDVESAE